MWHYDDTNVHEHEFCKLSHYDLICESHHLVNDGKTYLQAIQTKMIQWWVMSQVYNWRPARKRFNTAPKNVRTELIFLHCNTGTETASGAGTTVTWNLKLHPPNTCSGTWQVTTVHHSLALTFFFQLVFSHKKMMSSALPWIWNKMQLASLKCTTA